MLKAIRIFLFVLIILGIGLIVTQSLWVSSLVNWILQNQNSAPTQAATQQVPTTPVVHGTKEKKIQITSATLGVGYEGMQEQYYKDSKYVYAGLGADYLKVISGADPATFTLDVKTASTTENYYLAFAQDKNHVYYYGKITDFTPEFVLLDAGSSKDCAWGPTVSDRVNGQLEFFIIAYDSNGRSQPSFVQIAGADPTTFEIVGSGYSKDKNHVWVDGSTTSADPTTFNASMAVRCAGGF